MGSFNAICPLSRTTIAYGDELILFPIFRQGEYTDRGSILLEYLEYQFAGMPILGTYGDSLSYYVNGDSENYISDKFNKDESPFKLFDKPYFNGQNYVIEIPDGEYFIFAVKKEFIDKWLEKVGKKNSDYELISDYLFVLNEHDLTVGTIEEYYAKNKKSRIINHWMQPWSKEEEPRIKRLNGDMLLSKTRLNGQSQDSLKISELLDIPWLDEIHLFNNRGMEPAPIRDMNKLFHKEYYGSYLNNADKKQELEYLMYATQTVIIHIDYRGINFAPNKYGHQLELATYRTNILNKAMEKEIKKHSSKIGWY
jgi:hypothetical protein